jgi:hypothetical protein
MTQPDQFMPLLDADATGIEQRSEEISFHDINGYGNYEPLCGYSANTVSTVMVRQITSGLNRTTVLHMFGLTTGLANPLG